ncbi:MAG: MBL fold metallo-hydrolase [Candidatus Geothermarchaeales archaeon]
MKLLRNLYWYPYRGFANNCNTCVFDDELLTLIDPGHRWNLESLLASMEEDGLKPGDIDLIINTHTHPDHCEANEALLHISKAKVALHKLEEAYLKGEGQRLYRMFGAEPPSFRVAFHLGDDMSLGGVNLRVIHTPGHSPGSISLYWGEQRVLICGDLVFAQGVGRVDLPGGSADQLKRSIEGVSRLEIDYLLPGHGEIVEGAENVRRNFDYIRRAYFDWL